MNARAQPCCRRPVAIGHRAFTDGVARPVYEEERRRFIVEVGERIDGVWLLRAALLAFVRSWRPMLRLHSPAW
jgi:hypothetical protein